VFPQRMNPVDDARYGIPLTRFTFGGLIGEALLVSMALLLNFNQHCDDIFMVPIAVILF